MTESKRLAGTARESLELDAKYDVLQRRLRRMSLPVPPSGCEWVRCRLKQCGAYGDYHLKENAEGRVRH